MSYATAQSALAPLADDAARLAFAAETVYAWRSVYVSYRTLDARWGKSKTDAAQAVVVAASPRYDGYMSVPGDDKGNGGGVDLAREDVQALLLALPQQTSGLVAVDDVSSLLDLARTPLGPRHQAEWGLATFDADTLARLNDWVRFETLSAGVDALTAAIDASYPGASVLAGVSIDKATRDALPALAQTWRTKLAAGQDVSAMPADAAAAWAIVRGA